MADRTLFVLTPDSAQFPSTNFPELLVVNRRKVLGFDDTTPEACYWEFVAPVGITTPVHIAVHYFMASATSGKIDFEASLECISDGDSLDLDASDSFDTANTITAPTVPGTAGYLDIFTCTLTNNDSITAGDSVRLELERDADDGTNDTASGDCYVYKVEFLDDGG